MTGGLPVRLAALLFCSPVTAVLLSLISALLARSGHGFRSAAGCQKRAAPTSRARMSETLCGGDPVAHRASLLALVRLAARQATACLLSPRRHWAHTGCV